MFTDLENLLSTRLAYVPTFAGQQETITAPQNAIT